ncbi:family 43 glycosylhydrolase [Mucilaginibacter sp. BJC16-A38]|nr:family 43 glycosylhydrolase [Mucilaginibacter phenanthrenivorans]
MQYFRLPLLLFVVLLSAPICIYAQTKPTVDSSSFYQTVQTYVNPVLPGDHPDPTLLQVGKDFYHCGSSFHFNPYLPVYHSTDLVHWKIIGRVLAPAKADWVTDRPSAGIWQGAITYFYGSYWIYFSANGQWFSRASSPAGPWSAPVHLKTDLETGNPGYDNSIFVDDDSKPYMLIKNGQKANRLHELGRDGQLTGHLINLDWVNAHLQYSWAEGPVMCKRNDVYYYFPAGDVTGGQYVLKSSALTGDSTKWQRLGNFFKPVTDPHAGFRHPNHISAPVQLSDGTWWTLGQSYEKYDGDDWSGMGRQTSLYPVIWEGDRPWGMAPASQPIVKPDLPQSGILWRSVTTDYFAGEAPGLCWHFLTKASSCKYSLTARKGWIRLSPDSVRTHIVQKETDHFYTVITRVDLAAADKSAKAGIYLSNGGQTVIGRLYTGYSDGRKIVLQLDTAIRTLTNPFGRTVWLKLVRNGHQLSGYFSGDKKAWTTLGAPVSAIKLDKAQPNYNSWVGTSIGLFAEGKPADFDCFICKDGRSVLPAVGYSNYFGTAAVSMGNEKAVTNTSGKGGWFMISGVETGRISPLSVALTCRITARTKIEIWLDDLQKGRLIATLNLDASGSRQWQVFSKTIKGVTGQHDVFVRFIPGTAQSAYIKSIQFGDHII